jgi:hypothetical protein
MILAEYFIFLGYCRILFIHETREMVKFITFCIETLDRGPKLFAKLTFLVVY